jgi:hypothetical protein
MSDDDSRPTASMPTAHAWISDKGSHFAMWDDQIPFFRELLFVHEERESESESKDSQCAVVNKKAVL